MSDDKVFYPDAPAEPTDEERLAKAFAAGERRGLERAAADYERRADDLCAEADADDAADRPEFATSARERASVLRVLALELRALGRPA